MRKDKDQYRYSPPATELPWRVEAFKDRIDTLRTGTYPERLNIDANRCETCISTLRTVDVDSETLLVYYFSHGNRLLHNRLNSYIKTIDIVM